MGKQDNTIIIDGVNIAGCCYIADGNECEAYQTECEAQNCYYKQLQRKEQELKISQHYNDELTKYILGIGELFNITQYAILVGKNCIEYYAILSSTISNRIKDLQTENEELKKSSGFWGRTTARTQDKSDRYKQALKEIQQELRQSLYCESQECGCDDYEKCLECTKNQILQKCEVLKDG